MIFSSQSLRPQVTWQVKCLNELNLLWHLVNKQNCLIFFCECLTGKYWVPFSGFCWVLMLCFILKITLWLTPHLYLNPAALSLYTSYHFLALPFPFCLSSTFPPQGYPLLLSWPPAAHCEVGSRLLSWALTALLSLALMQVDFDLMFDLASLPPSLTHTYFSIPSAPSSLCWK